jgi:hypothetical protein
VAVGGCGWLLASVLVGLAPPAGASIGPKITGDTPSHGTALGGTRVTVVGSGFTRVSKVTFGSRVGTAIHVLSSTKLTVTTPRAVAVEVVNVRVSTSFGTSSVTRADRYTYDPAPRVSSLSPASAADSGGAAVTIKGSGFTGASEVRFGVALYVPMKVISDSEIVVHAPPGSGTVNVQVSGQYGTSPVTSADSFTFVHHTPPPPTLLPIPSVAVTYRSQSTITLSWTNPGNAAYSGVQINRLAGSAAPSAPQYGDLVIVLPADVTSFTDRGLNPATQYSYSLFAGSVGIGGRAAPASVTATTRASDTVAPGQVANLQAVALDGSDVELTWANPSDDDLAGVCLFRTVGTAPTLDPTGHSCTQVGAGETSYLDANVEQESTYTYSLFAHDGAPNYATPVAAVTVRTLRYQPPPAGTGLYARVTATSVVFNRTTPLPPWSGRGAGTERYRRGWASPATPWSDDRALMQEYSLTPNTAYSYAFFGESVNRDYGPAETITLTTRPAQAVAPRFAWSAAARPDLYVQHAGLLSCASASFCLAMSPGGTYVTFDGTRWAAPRSDRAVEDPVAVSCPTSSFCAAIGGEDVLMYQHGSWSAPIHVDPDDAASLDALSCPTAMFCVAFDDHGARTTFDGSRWSHMTPLSPDSDPVAVSCVAASFCATLNGWTFRDGAWTQVATGGTGFPAHLARLSCVSSTFCLAVDQLNVAAKYFNGLAWLSLPAPVSRTDGQWPTSVSCVSSTHCVALAAPGLAVTFNGSSWSSPTTIDQHADDLQVSCVSATWCQAIDRGGEPEPLGSLAHTNSIAFRGASWAAPVDALHSNQVVGASCGSTTFCVAVDSDGHALTYNGRQWGTRGLIDSMGHPEAISCASRTLCVVVDGAGYAVRWDGTRWSSPIPIDVGHELTAVSCPTTTYCLMVDHSGRAVGYTGTRWGLPGPVGSADYLWGVSCASATYCVALGPKTEVHVNGHWIDLPGPNTDQLGAISCFTPTSCVAAGTSLGREYLIHLNGTASSASTFFGMPGNYVGFSWVATPDSVSCTASSFCIIGNGVGDFGDVAQVAGTQIATPIPIGGFTGVGSVSCRSAALCVAVDRQTGAVSIGRATN